MTRFFWRYGWVIVLAALANPRVQAFDAIYAFGDSTTDTGRNKAPAGLYFDGRWSNGPLWVEGLSTRLGFAYDPAKNFARSGAETKDLAAQITEAGSPPDAGSALFVLWVGANDVINNVEAAGFDDSRWAAILGTAVNNLSNAVVRLYAAGARDILVPNVTDMTHVPAVKAYIDAVPFLSALVREYARVKVSELNANLAAALNGVKAGRSDLRLSIFDTYAFLNDIVANPSRNGFTKVYPDALTDPALSDKSFSGPGASYIFWDGIHPTSKSHALLAEAFQALLPATPTERLTIRRDSGRVLLGFSGLRAGRTYALETSANLAAWNEVSGVNPDPNGAAEVEIAADGVQAFYRLRVR